MNKNTLIAICLIPIFLLLFFASILGENHRATDVVDDYIKNLRNGDFSAFCIPIHTQGTSKDDKTSMSCADSNFVFYLSLVSLGHILDEDISVEPSISQFWVPFTSSKEILVNVSLQSEDTISYLENVFVIRRDGWSWNLSEIRISDTLFSQKHKHFRQTLDLDRYITTNAQEIQIKAATINVAKLTEIDKLILRYNLQEVESKLD